MKTRWGEALDENAVLPEYPRPQLRRDSYLNLNGRWDYAITVGDEPPARWDGTIVVPFSPESELSGVMRSLRASETLWYRRAVTLPEGFCRDRVLLHFGAVDQEAIVYWNGREVTRHDGGYTTFSVDVTDAVQAEQNELLVRVRDDTDASWHSRGKQSTKRGGIWYTPQSGIWQTVWMESVPSPCVRALRLIPKIDTGEIVLTVEADTDVPCLVELGERRLCLQTNTPTAVRAEQSGTPRLWTPESPHLYPFVVTLGEDRVESYFALRDVRVEKDGAGVQRLFLNGKPYFQTGLLDQGYWPDGLYTPPSDEAMVWDIQTARQMGFNMLRKHIKIEPMRWYYHCDRLGMLVWQDMPNGGGRYKLSTITLPLLTGRHLADHHYRAFAREDAQGREAYRRELAEMVVALRNVPCVVLWVPFNEGWGQFDAKDAYALIDRLDGTRPIDHASGWHDQGIGPLKSLHVYFKEYRFRPDRLGRAVALTEFGGYSLRTEGHCYGKRSFGYKRFDSPGALTEALERLYRRQIIPAAHAGLCAAVYTQLTDVEDEINGLITYDREVVKADAARMRRLNEAACAAGAGMLE